MNWIFGQHAEAENKIPEEAGYFPDYVHDDFMDACRFVNAFTYVILTENEYTIKRLSWYLIGFIFGFLTAAIIAFLAVGGFIG